MPPRIDGLSDLVEIGRGGFGVVYRATDAAFHRQVAVKVLTGEATTPEAEARFERECQALGALSGHPNIVAVHASGKTDNNQLYMSMELLDGGSLSQRLHRDGNASPQDVVSWGVMLAGALETAHRAGIVHRDVKPGNILFSSFGTPKLVDFGIARMSNAFETSTGNVTATLNHAAPEVLEGRPASPSADIYALASTLYQALAGFPPFWIGGETTIAPLVSRITTMPPPELKGVPEPLAAVITKGLSKSPEERYSSAGEMGEALRAAGRQMSMNPPTLPIASGSAIAEAARLETSAQESGTQVMGPAATAQMPSVGQTARMPASGQTSRLGQAPPPPPVGPAPARQPYAAGSPSQGSGSGRGKVAAAVVIGALVLGGGALAATALLGGDADPPPETGAVTSGPSSGVTSTATTDTSTPTFTTSSPTTLTLDPSELQITEKESVSYEIPVRNDQGNVDIEADGLPEGLTISGHRITGKVPVSALNETTDRSDIRTKEYTVNLRAKDKESSATSTMKIIVTDKYVEMPDLVGKSYDDSMKADLDKMGSVIERCVTEKDSKKAGERKVLATSIKKGDDFEWGRLITVYYSEADDNSSCLAKLPSNLD